MSDSQQTDKVGLYLRILESMTPDEQREVIKEIPMETKIKLIRLMNE